MAQSNPVFRVHPAIGVARVGNSEDYLLAPESIAGLGDPHDGSTTGGLPVVPGTERQTITSDQIRDENGALKRQAARFKIFMYPADTASVYPSGAGEEIQLGSVIGDKTVTDIIWTVHVANKKANSYQFNDDLGNAVYEKANAAHLRVRNPDLGDNLANNLRLKSLVIDPGPRALRASEAGLVAFDKATSASYWDGQTGVTTNRDYPKSFPDDSFTPLFTPTGSIDSLGQIKTDAQGRLLFVGGYGKACARYASDGKPFPLLNGEVAPGNVADVNETGWFDDSADGPVRATMVFDDGSSTEVHGGWVVVTPPSFSPQCLNVVSLWDDIFDTWVRKLHLLPDLYGTKFNTCFQPSFHTDIHPIFRAASLQRWNTNLPGRAIQAHDAVGAIEASDLPQRTIMSGLAFIRDPNNAEQSTVGSPFMPLAIGDVGQAFMTVTETQYFFLQQWNANRYLKEACAPLGPGEQMDRTALMNCMGGGFAPGIELTFVVRDPAFYQADWRDTGAGPFRLRGAPLDYDKANSSQPFLGVGFIPMHPGPDGVVPARLEPGDATKFMALPWHTDFNACATHNTDPNPRNSTTLYWAWPSQRPVQIYRAQDVHGSTLGPQHYSVRGKGTYSDDLGTAGRFQVLLDIILRWHMIGTVIQASAIDGGPHDDPDLFLEVQSQLDEVEIKPWPMNSNHPNE